MIYKHWSIFHAPPVDPAAADFEVGFNNDSETVFRWVQRNPVSSSDRDVARMVPTDVRLLFGPCSCWDAQDDGKIDVGDKIILVT